MDDLLNQINARRSGTQPRPSTRAEFPWTFGHPDHPYNMNENPHSPNSRFVQEMLSNPHENTIATVFATKL
jgi:hypothetical protein